MSTEDKFLAAVEVVNSIPYDGTFEPSDEIMLKFYAYQKQATEGPCTDSKPFIWNTVARNKWNAWWDLGDMSIETAMESYVEELSKVIETMSYNEKIAKFISLMGSFYEVVSSEEIDLEKHQQKGSGEWSEDAIPAAIFENYQSQTISDMYHIAKKIDDHSGLLSYESNPNRNIVEYSSPESPPKVLPHSSSSSSSISSEISNFDLLSDLSGDDFHSTGQRDTLHLFNNNRDCSSNHILAKNDLFILTFINLQSSMEVILEKFNKLNDLGRQQNQEASCTIPEDCDDWGLNLAGTAFALLWPIVVEIMLG